MEARAQARYVRVTPMKARRVIDLIRGMSAQDAQAVLTFAPQAASEPVGKVLAADKVLNVARAAGPALFGDKEWAGKYAKAVLASLHRPIVRVDVESMSIAY